MENNNYSCLFDEKYRETYRNGETGPTDPSHSFDGANHQEPIQPLSSSKDTKEKEMVIPAPADGSPELFGHPVSDFINALLPNGVPQGSRHKEALRLSSDLLILLDGDKKQTEKVLLSQPWVQEIITERGMPEITGILNSAKKRMEKRESESIYAPQPSKRMRNVIEQVTKTKYRVLTAGDLGRNAEGQDRDEEMNRYLEKLGKEIKSLSKYYILLILFCFGHKLKAFAAAMFTGSAFSMTLMTRCWYYFYAETKNRCRLNSILELIGPPGSGKRFVVNLYRIMMEPIKKSDVKQIEALNRWKDEQLSKGANKDKSIPPTGVLRCLPAETSVAGIRDAMINAKEIIDGEEWPLHVFLFDSELDNTIRQMKKSYMDILTLHLKSFHNEPHGSLLKTTSARVGEFNVHMNCVYTGTEFALNKQVDVESFQTGLYGRLTIVPMPHSDFEMMEKDVYTEDSAKIDEQIKEWAYKLDKCKGQIPIQMLSDRLYEWTKHRMEDAKEDDSKVDDALLRRCAWHAINYSLPFIISRHWGEMVLDDDGYWKPGVGFKVDHIDWKLCKLIANAQFAFQRYFVGPIAAEFYENQAISQTSAHSLQSRSKKAFMKLPNPFTANDVLKAFEYNSMGSVNSKLKRLQDNGLIERIRGGEDKGKYRKIV